MYLIGQKIRQETLFRGPATPTPANCTQNTNMDLGLSHLMTALCRASSRPANVNRPYSE